MHAASEAAVNPILDLEQRQDEVLKQLDELNRRIEAVLGEFAPAKLSIERSL